MRSMTGYGLGEIKASGWNLKVEIRSVNGRYLDIHVKIPRELSNLENQVIAVIQKRADRGKVNVHCFCQQSKGVQRPDISFENARQYYQLLTQLKDKLHLKGEIDLQLLATFPEVIKPTNLDNDETVLPALLLKSLEKAIENWETNKLDEGNNLSRDMEKRLKILSNIIKEIERRAPQRLEDYQKKIKDRLETFLKGNISDPQRLHQEIFLMSDRLDITEECTRFKSHLKSFSQALQQRNAVGNKLNFILQELQREANTISAKANDLLISKASIQLREEIEKIREQTQNIE